eukprot:scaffold52252_cov35-Cyclotella_meneghiniana.AAC.2
MFQLGDYKRSTTAVSHNDGQSRKAFKNENDMHAATMPLTTFIEEIFFPHEFKRYSSRMNSRDILPA